MFRMGFPGGFCHQIILSGSCKPWKGRKPHPESLSEFGEGFENQFDSPFLDSGKGPGGEEVPPGLISVGYETSPPWLSALINSSGLMRSSTLSPATDRSGWAGYT